MRHRSRLGALAVTLLVLGAGAVLAGAGVRPPAPAPLTSGPTGVRRLGWVSPDQPVAFTLLLRLPGQHRLDAALLALVDPGSPHFHRFIDPAAFGARFGLPDGRLDGLLRGLRARGLTVRAVDPQRTAIHLSARAGAIERLFGVRLGRYRARAGGRFRMPAGPVRIPRAWRAVVTGVTGLDTRPQWSAHDVPLGGLDPAIARAAYDLAPLHRAGINGQGETIAVISFAGFDPADTATFARRNGIAGPAPQVVPVDGGSYSNAVETELDVELVRAIAPAARILVFEAPLSASYADLIHAVVRSGADIGTSSWGTCEPQVSGAERRADAAQLSSAYAAGLSLFVASGDQGAYDCQQSDLSDQRLSVDWPASSAAAIAVGGTRLSLTPGLAYAGEAAWEDQLSGQGTGGGLSTGDSRPIWQAGPGVIGPYSNGHRQVPDVAADADPGTGWSIYAFGSWGSAGGTSAAAPFWAASTLLIRQYAQRHGIARLGPVAPILYALAAARQRYPPFHDVTRGGNRHFLAAPGWDPATGLGSPDVYNLARDMVSYLRRHLGVRAGR